MAKVLHPITACLKKGEKMDDYEKDTPGNDTKENKSQEVGLLWRMSSGLYNVGSGAVGLGVGSVKWAASTTYSVGTGVVSAAANTAVVQKVVSKVLPSSVIPKPKKE